jgi:hypothetical protein
MRGWVGTSVARVFAMSAVALVAWPGLVAPGHMERPLADRGTPQWHMIKESKSWGVKLGSMACTSELSCIALGTRRGVSYAVRLDGAGIGSDSAIRSKTHPDGPMVCSTLPSA